MDFQCQRYAIYLFIENSTSEYPEYFCLFGDDVPYLDGYAILLETVEKWSDATMCLLLPVMEGNKLRQAAGCRQDLGQ